MESRIRGREKGTKGGVAVSARLLCTLGGEIKVIFSRWKRPTLYSYTRARSNKRERQMVVFEDDRKYFVLMKLGGVEACRLAGL